MEYCGGVQMPTEMRRVGASIEPLGNVAQQVSAVSYDDCLRSRSEVNVICWPRAKSHSSLNTNPIRRYDPYTKRRGTAFARDKDAAAISRIPSVGDTTLCRLNDRKPSRQCGLDFLQRRRQLQVVGGCQGYLAIDRNRSADRKDRQGHDQQSA